MKIQLQNRLCVVIIMCLCTSMWIGCKEDKNTRGTESDPEKETLASDTAVHVSDSTSEELDYDPEQWTEITEASGVVLDIKYATADNFTKNQIYPCARCFLRPEVAEKLLTLQNDISTRYGLSLKLYDCYRPRPAQQKLWDIVPDARYVTPPSQGSMHNRGLAVDISLVDKEGKELDMGTPYDFFGYEAYTTNTDLPEPILRNRKILTKLMNIHGLQGIRTEWWHFSHKKIKAPLDSWEWPCEG